MIHTHTSLADALVPAFKDDLNPRVQTSRLNWIPRGWLLNLIPRGRPLVSKTPFSNLSSQLNPSRMISHNLIPRGWPQPAFSNLSSQLNPSRMTSHNLIPRGWHQPAFSNLSAHLPSFSVGRWPSISRNKELTFGRHKYTNKPKDRTLNKESNTRRTELKRA